LRSRANASFLFNDKSGTRRINLPRSAFSERERERERGGGGVLHPKHGASKEKKRAEEEEEEEEEEYISTDVVR